MTIQPLSATQTRRQGFFFDLILPTPQPMKTLSLSLLSLLFLLVASCSLPKDRVRIEGSYKNLGDAEFYIYDETGAEGAADTIAIREGKFTFERPLEKSCVLTLLFPNFSEIRLVAEPGKTITVKGDASQLMKTEIAGTEENEALTRFRLENNTRPNGDQLLAAAQYIRSHADRLSSQALFMQYFARAEQFDHRTGELLKALRRAQPNNSALIALERQLTPMTTTTVGASLPDIAATDIDGRTVRTADYGGRPLLVLFWASWNNDCRQLATAVRRCRTAYGNRFDVLTLSFDFSSVTTRRRAKTDSLPGSIVCDGSSFGSPLATKLGVRYVPGLLLVDKNKKIVARDLPPEQLYNALGKLLTP